MCAGIWHMAPSNRALPQVLVRIYASAVNRADTLQRKYARGALCLPAALLIVMHALSGAYPPPAGASEVLGLEMAGVVERLGPDCRSGTRVGDRVMAVRTRNSPLLANPRCKRRARCSC